MIWETPDRAPLVETLSPPLGGEAEIKENVPVELPITTLPVFVVPRFKAPDPFGATVIAALPDGVLIVDAEPFPKDKVVPLTVKDPLLVVVIPVFPKVRDVALVFPIFKAAAESRTNVPDVAV